MIHMEDRHWKIVRDILNQYPYTFYAYGSRVKGNPKRFSDLDLCFTDPIPWNIQSHIDEDFEESDLPFKVDVIDWNLMGPEFQDLIRKDLLLVKKGQHSDKKEV